MFKRALGLTIMLAAAMAGMHFAAQSKSSDRSNAPVQSLQENSRNLPPSPHNPTASSSEPAYSGGCSAYRSEQPHSYPYDENQGTAKKLLDSFFATDTSAPGAASAMAGARFAIALAPDPRHTHLSLMFDREIAVVQQAAQDDGFFYNSSWLPWQRENPQDSGLSDRQHSADLTEGRESCPGILLFRGSPDPSDSSHDAALPYKKALIVFVVGEQPTGGINEDQWSNVLTWLTVYAASPNRGGNDGVLRILGPSFTGTLVSLERDLTQAYASPTEIAARFPNVDLFSGSVSGCSTIQWFQNQMQLAPGMSGRVRFGSFQENDELHIYRFLTYLRNQGTQPKDTAILSEDETAYANAPVSPAPPKTPADLTIGTAHSCQFSYAEENRPVHLVYPRDISAVRNAYEKQAVFNASETSKEPSSHPILRDESDAKTEGGEITDTVNSYSGTTSALDEEAYLYGLVSFLRVHHTRYLLLRCTNPLDFLFLTQFFHRAYPEARVVTVGSDLLFRREIDTTEFRGVLSLSSYPLMPRDQHWSRITEDSWEMQPHSHLTFENQLTEGMYNALRYLLQPDSSLNIQSPASTGRPIRMNRVLPTPDYADPFWLHSPRDAIPSTHPPTWLSAVGRDGYWPIAVIRDSPYPEIHLEYRDAKTTEPPALPKVGNPPLSTMVELLGNWGGAHAPNDQNYELKRSETDQTIYADKTAFAARLLINLPLPWTICALLAALLAAYQVWGVLRGAEHPLDGLFAVFRLSEVPSQSLLLGTNCALALMPLVEVFEVGRIPNADLYNQPNWQLDGTLGALLAAVVLMTGVLFQRKRHYTAAWFLGILSGFVAAYEFAIWSFLKEPNRFPTYYRMAHLTDGVSPLAPILLLTVGFYLWNWSAMAGNLMLAEGMPTLPPLRSGTAPAWKTMQWRNILWKIAGLQDIPRILKQIHEYCSRRWSEFIGFDQLTTPATVPALDDAHKRISQEVGNLILNVANPLSFPARIVAIPAFLLVAAVVCFFLPVPDMNLPLLSLEGKAFDIVVNVCLLWGFLLTAGEALRLYSSWVNLRRLLHALARLRLRRTLARLRPIDAHSLWSVSGNVQRVQYKLFIHQVDAARRTLKLSSGNLPYLHRVTVEGKKFAAAVNSVIGVGIPWDARLNPADPASLSMRELLSCAVAEVLNDLLIHEWDTETGSLNLEGVADEAGEDKAGPAGLPLSKKRAIRAAEEFVSYHYIAFIQNIAARLRTMTLSMVFLFVTVCFAISFYPFVPRTEITVWMIFNLALIGLSVAYVFAGMERDEIMSYIANTQPGRLGTEFWFKMIGFLAGPVIGILTTQFPAISDSVLEWLQPGLDAIK